MPMDLREARKWFTLSAQQGNLNAQGKIAFMYDTGEGVPQNFSRAYIWYSLAAINGDEFAASGRDGVAKLLTKAQLGEAQKLAAICFESDFKDCPF